MEISPDIFIQITEMGHCKLIMGQFIAHSLNMKHLLVTSFLNNRFTWKLHTAEGNLVTFFYLYKNYKSVWQSGTNSGTKARTETPYQKNVLISYCRTPI